MEGKKFVCFDLSKFNQDHQINGIGSLVLEYFKETNEAVKVINTSKILGIDKRGKKFEYFKTKMKGIPKPQKVFHKKYDLD